MPSARPLTTGTPDAPRPRPIAYATSVPYGTRPPGADDGDRGLVAQDGERLGAAGREQDGGRVGQLRRSGG